MTATRLKPPLRIAAMLCLALALSGCGGAMPETEGDPEGKAGTTGPFSNLFAGAGSKTSKAPLARASMAKGDIIVSGPNGYCLDPVTTSTKSSRGFALIASCHILSEGKVGSPVEPLLVSVAVGPKDSAPDIPTPEQLARTAQAPLLGGGTSAGLVTANLETGGDAVLQGGDPRHWRGAFVHGDRLVSLALYVPNGSVFAGSQGGNVLGDVHRKIVALSPPSDTKPDTAPDTEKDHTAEKPKQDSLLGRLFKP